MQICIYFNLYLVNQAIYKCDEDVRKLTKKEILIKAISISPVFKEWL